MTRRSRALGAPRSRLLALLTVLALTTVFSVVGAQPVSADGGADPTGDTGRLSGAGPEATMRAGSTPKHTRSRHITLEWKGKTKPKRYTRRVTIPGVGELSLKCQPKKVMITLEANHRDRETQLWMAKYEDKSYGQAVAVKTVRIYRYANANDSSEGKGKGGTGNPQSEGLNQRSGVNGVENYGKGYGHGIISQRGSRNTSVGDDALEPVTTFDVNWYWNGFDYPVQYRYCKIDMMLVTSLSPRLGINWHGNDDARGNEYQRVRVPSIGYVQLRCNVGRSGKKLVSFIPKKKRTKVYVEKVQGEGRVDDHVSTRNLTRDRETGLLGPVRIPNNGIMRFYVDKGKKTVPFILSSYQKTNDPRGRLNTCEIAMGRFPR
ncbi:hypothetical protein BH09ACT12_BH09ACT12_11980 [soil metagenome]